MCDKSPSDEDEFWEEWARFSGPISLGEKQFEDSSEIAFCSPACLVRWISENYYIDGNIVHWTPLEEEVLTT